MDMNITIWVTGPGRPPITHQGSLRGVCIMTESTLRTAQKLGWRDTKVVVASDTPLNARCLIQNYLMGVIAEMESSPLPEPEIGWKPRVAQ